MDLRFQNNTYFHINYTIIFEKNVFFVICDIFEYIKKPIYVFRLKNNNFVILTSRLIFSRVVGLLCFFCWNF